MTEARANIILHCVARTGQVPNDTTPDELAQLDDMVVRDGNEYSLTTLGEMEIGE